MRLDHFSLMKKAWNLDTAVIIAMLIGPSLDFGVWEVCDGELFPNVLGLSY